MRTTKTPAAQLAGIVVVMAFALPAPAGLPSGIIPPLCQNRMGTDLILDCYLNDASNQDSAFVISRTFPSRSYPNSAVLSWPQWSTLPALARNGNCALLLGGSDSHGEFANRRVGLVRE